MKILFLSRWFPLPANNGSKLRIYNLLQGLARHHEITLLSFTDQSNSEPALPELKQICKKIQIVPWKQFKPHKFDALANVFSKYPRSIVSTFSDAMREQIEKAQSAQQFDLIIASQIDMLIYGLYFGDMPALLEELEIGVYHQRIQQARNVLLRFRYRLTWEKQKSYLTERLARFRACTVVSEQERQLMANALPNYQNVQVIPNGIDLASYVTVERKPIPNRLIFTGSFRYQANYDAMCWFVSQVYPLIRAKIPNVQLTITGDHANMPLPSTENIELVGFVDDVRPLIASSWVSLAPILQGGGTRLKILEAMALHTPVVATLKGAEGLDAHHNKNILLADSPQAFADETIRLLQETGLRQRIAENAYRLVAEQYDWQVLMLQFLNLIERITRD